MSDPCLSPSASSLALADLLSKVLSCPTRSACLSLLSRTKKAKGKEVISQKQRQSLCKLAGLEQDWIHCNQKISGNVEDLASLICGELYDPFIFYTRTLLQVNINSSTSHQEATVPLKWDKRKKFWSTSPGFHPVSTLMMPRCISSKRGQELVSTLGTVLFSPALT